LSGAVAESIIPRGPMTHFSLSDRLSLRDKHAWVSAATRGIGRSVALMLARQEARVSITGRREADVRRVLDELPHVPSSNHHGVIVDHADPTGVRTAIEHHLREAGPIHILVSNSGGPPGRPITEATGDQFIAWFTQHIVCNQERSQAVLPGMKAASFGRIVNIVSTSVKQPIRGLGVSNTVRGAVASWAKTLAREVAAFGITVNSVLPGATATDRLLNIVRSRAAASGQPEAAVREAMQAEIPAGRFADPEEIAAAVAGEPGGRVHHRRQSGG